MVTETAIIVVDMVYDFTNPNGKVFYPENRQILPRIVDAVDVCRDEGCLVIYIQHRYRAGKYDKNLETMRPNCVEGTGGEALDELLDVREEDYVIQKRRYSAFFGTDLDLVLRENGIKNVIIVGTKTNNCIRATVEDAYYLDYNAIVIKECVATNDPVVNEVHLTDIDKYLGRVIELDNLQAELEELASD